MANVSDVEVTIARAYSRAMLNLAESRGQADALLAELTELVSYLDRQPDLDALFTSPMVDPAHRKKAIERIFRGKAGDLMVDTLQILNRKERLGLIRAVVEAYRLALEGLRNQVDVHVRTAVPLPGKLRKRLHEVASRYAGKDAQLVETVDESLIGGIVLQIGDQKFDASIASGITRLQGALSERASREIHSKKAYIVAGDN